MAAIVGATVGASVCSYRSYIGNSCYTVGILVKTLTKNESHNESFFILIFLTFLILLKFVVCFDHWPQLSLNVICFTFFYQIYLVLNGNPQKWQNGSHLWCKQRLSIQRNQRHSLTYQVSKFMQTLSNLKVKLIMFHKSILKDDDI